MSVSRRRIWALSLSAAVVTLAATPAWAADGRIQQVQSPPGAVEFVFSAEGLADGESIDPASVRVQINGEDAVTTATPLGSTGSKQQRTVLLALDTSGSMALDNRLPTAKAAANTYLDALPADVDAGLVTFATTAKVAVKPTSNRAKVRDAIKGLRAVGSTALNDAMILSVDSLGTEGSRNLVVLSDGEDEGSEASAGQAATAIKDSGVVVDAVSLGKGAQEAALAKFAAAGNGTIVTATDANGLTEAFESAARTVETQLAVRAEVPLGVQPGTAQIAVSAVAGGSDISDSTAAIITAGTTPPVDASGGSFGPQAVVDGTKGPLGNSWVRGLVIVLIFLSLAMIFATALGALDRKNRTRGRVQRRLDDVAALSGPRVTKAQDPETVLGESVTVRKAVSFAEKVASGRDTTAVTSKLEAANVQLRPGEWVIVHSLVAVLAGLLVTLISDFNWLWTLLAIIAGLAGPWLYLSFKADQRRKKFYQQLPDAMQMLAGSLSAGYSLPQAIDSVGRETGGPLGQELNRALLESRLGLPLEETLEAAAQRMDSQDFHWVVMAIRINRKVGGNLAEVLTNVGKTIRERERLRRQVKALAAEGVLSAWILGALPLVIAFFVLASQPDYLAPMLTEPVGWVMMAVGAVLYVIGIFWLRNLVRMEV